MSDKTGYKQQRNLSSVQLLAEVPFFIVSLLSALFSGTMLLYVDLLDSLSYIIRNAMVTILSNKLSKDLRYEYNYGVGKIEAISSLFCDSIVIFCMFLMSLLSVSSFFHPREPSEFLIVAAGIKFYDILWDLAIFLKQRKILKITPSALCKSNYATALGDLLFDSFTGFSLLIMWLFRNNPIGVYISPTVSILVAACLIVGCIKRIKVSLNELTDKTLPEEQQMKILKALNRHFDSYLQIHSIDSRKIGKITRIDINLSFENDTRVEEVLSLQQQIQNELGEQIDECIVNIIMHSEQTKS